MSRISPGRTAVLLILPLAGCGSVGPRRDAGPTTPPVSSRGKDPGKQVAAGPGSSREPPLADPSTMIPPPPNMFPDIPPAPGRDDSLAVAPAAKPGKAGVVPADGIAVPRDGAAPPELVRARGEQPAAPETNLEAVRRLHRRAAERFAAMDGLQCRLTRRETIGDKPMPQEELEYTMRREPYSLHIKWVGKEAQGRELIYVAGKFDGKVQILTGKGDGWPIPSGKRFAFPPTDSNVRSKSRFDIREGGMGMSLTWFGKVVAEMERDPAQANRMKYLGVKKRQEREAGLEAVEETIPPGWEPLLPKGGKRTTYFDPDPASPSYGLPVVLATFADTGREVEFYWFDQLRPIRPTDADFDPDQLWKK